MRVEILKEAFAVMLANCVEVYKREAFGLLVGRERHGAMTISSAVPCQAGIINGFNAVEFLGSRVARLEKVLNATCAPDFVIGDYHSHPSYGKMYFPPEPGDEDCRDILRRRKPLYLIASVRDKKRSMPWHNRADGGLVGTIGKHMIEVAAYQVASDTIYAAGVTCPYAIGRKF